MNKDGDVYFTSDMSEAAFLAMRGYTLLGAVDTGSQRLEFALTHTDLRIDPERMKEDLLKKNQEYTLPFDFPGDDSGRKVNFKDYFLKIRMCKKALQFPVPRKNIQ